MIVQAPDARARGRSRAGDARGGPGTSRRRAWRRQLPDRRSPQPAPASGPREGGGGRRSRAAAAEKPAVVAEKPAVVPKPAAAAAPPPAETAPRPVIVPPRVVTEPKDAKVLWAGTVIGRSPIDGARVPCGPATVTIERERWQPVTVDVDRAGGRRGQGPRTAAPAAHRAGRQLDTAGRADQRRPRRRGRAPKRIDVQRFEQVQIRATLKGYQPWNKTSISRMRTRSSTSSWSRASSGARLSRSVVCNARAIAVTRMRERARHRDWALVNGRVAGVFGPVLIYRHRRIPDPAAPRADEWRARLQHLSHRVRPARDGAVLGADPARGTAAFNAGFGAIDLYQVVAGVGGFFPARPFRYKTADHVLHLVLGLALVAVAPRIAGAAMSLRRSPLRHGHAAHARDARGDGGRRGRRRRLRRGPDGARARGARRPSCSARRPRSSCPRARWPTRSRSLLHCRPGDEVIVGRGRALRALRDRAPARRSAGVQFAESARATALHRRRRRCGGACPAIATPRRARASSRVENTHNRGGGADLRRSAQLDAVAARARARGLALHLDGARIWNAARRDRRAAERELAAPFDTVSRLLLEGPRRAGRLACSRGARERDRARAPLPQDAGRRHAPGRHPRGGGAVRARAPSRAARRRPRQRPPPRRAAWRAIAGVARRPGRRRDQHRHLRVCRVPPPSWPRPRRAASASRDRATRLRAVTHLDVDAAGIDRAIAAVRAALSGWRNGTREAHEAAPSSPTPSAAAPRLRAGAAPPDERVLEFRHLVLDHLHPGRRHHVVPARGLRVGGAAAGIVWPLGVAFSLIVALCMAQVASAFPTAGGLYHWSVDPRRQGLGLGDRLVQPGRPRVRDRGRQRRRVRAVRHFVGPMLGIDPARLGTGHQIAGVALISLSHALLNHFGHPRDDAADRLFRLADLRGGAAADGRDAARRAGPRSRPAVHVRRQRRRGGRRRLAGARRPRGR